jgi:hypothetical protein
MQHVFNFDVYLAYGICHRHPPHPHGLHACGPWHTGGCADSVPRGRPARARCSSPQRLAADGGWLTALHGPRAGGWPPGEPTVIGGLLSNGSARAPVLRQRSRPPTSVCCPHSPESSLLHGAGGGHQP